MAQAIAAGAPDAERAELLDLLERMWRIRAFEEKASELYARGKIAGLLHLGIGQEGVAVGAASVLRQDDTVFAGHRPHAHILAKGADPVRVMAELAGRETGYCRGRGGSMHVVAREVGFMTATGVVGGNIPLALGSAFASWATGGDRVAICFFGDGAGQVGGFHESLNMAALWRLPIVFVCENNGYAEFSPLSAHTPVERLADHASTYAIPESTIDGNDVLAVRDAVGAALARARAGEGPSFVECLTYRLRGHYEGDPGKYRELAELSEWKEKDPIQRLERVLTDAGEPDADARAAEARARAEMDRVVDEALAAPPGDPSQLTRDVYATATDG